MSTQQETGKFEMRSQRAPNAAAHTLDAAELAARKIKRRAAEGRSTAH